MRAIAECLGITYRTVAFHKYEMMRKIGVMTNADLLNYAFRRHIFNRPRGRMLQSEARKEVKAR